MDQALDPRHPEPTGDRPEGRDEAWRNVYFGQLSKDLVPPHPEPPETPEEELTRAALEDPADVHAGDSPFAEPQRTPTFWRVVFVVVVAVVALGLVFLGRR